MFRPNLLKQIHFHSETPTSCIEEYKELQAKEKELQLKVGFVISSQLYDIAHIKTQTPIGIKMDKSTSAVIF